MRTRLVHALLLLCAAAAPLAVGASGTRARTDALPAIVFVSRRAPSGADSAQVPGLGPHGSTVIVGGRLLMRERDGRVHELVSASDFTDVQDPDVSPDAKRVVFSAVHAGESHWSLWTVGVDGSGLARVLPAAHDSADDIDPCWFGERVVYVRMAGGADGNLYDRGPSAHLRIRGAGPDAALSAGIESNGVLDPTVDPRTGRLVCSRWWYNPWRSDSAGSPRRAEIGAHAADDVNQWQVVSAEVVSQGRGSTRSFVLADLRLAAGGVAQRRVGMGLQPCVLTDGAIVATFARNTGLAPAPGALGVQRFAPPPSPGVRLAGAAIAADRADPYSEGEGLSAPAACAPAALPDGRVLVSMDRGARGDFGIYVLGADGTNERVVDLPGTLELDPAPVVTRAPGRVIGRALRMTQGFRFVDRDVFAGAGAPPRTGGTRLRFYALADSGGEPQARLVREVAVPRTGRVDERGLPALTPMFEQLIDSSGRALLSAHGPTQVRGFNSGAPGATVTCRGCHLGHSTLRH